MDITFRDVYAVRVYDRMYGYIGWLGESSRSFTRGNFYTRGTMLCESRVDIQIEGTWTIELARAGGAHR